MSENWTMTIDCVDARRQADFWKLALGYVDAPPPAGWTSWDDWADHFDIPADERGDGASIIDPDGAKPSIGFLRVPEGKIAKNRLHLDLQVAGGRHQPQHLREERITAKVDQLLSAGATIAERHENAGTLDHFILLDPEGNEFCVV